MHAAVLLLPDQTWFIRWHLYVFFVTHNRSYLILNLNLILKIPFRNTMHYLSEFSLQQDSKIMEQCLQSSSSKSFAILLLFVMLPWVYIRTGRAWKICPVTMGIEPTTCIRCKLLYCIRCKSVMNLVNIAWLSLSQELTISLYELLLVFKSLTIYMLCTYFVGKVSCMGIVYYALFAPLPFGYILMCMLSPGQRRGAPLQA